MKALLKSRHRQLRRIALNVFDTFRAWPADLYRPETDFDGLVLMADEQDFAEEDEDVVGRIVREEAPLLYASPLATRAVPCDMGGANGFALTGHGEINEFDPDMIWRFLIEEPSVPAHSVLTFELPVDFLENGTTRTIRLIKIDHKPAGGPPFSGIVHAFAWFHGDLGI